MLIYWTRQIKDVLEVDSKEDLDGDHTGPLQEIEFWRMRSRNLSGITKQLERPELTRVRQVLEKYKSPHLKEFIEQKEKITWQHKQAESNLR